MSELFSNKTTAKPPRVGVFKFASCDGCQLSLLDCEDELLAVAKLVDFVYFPEASSKMGSGPFDIALVEGSITTPHDVERIQQVRRESKVVVTIGACATAGGIQALRNWGDHQDFLRCVYASPEYISSLATSTAIGSHIGVDYELRGCPISRQQLLELLTALVKGVRPRLPQHSVCIDCKIRNTVCVAVAKGVPCLGPITQSGCGAICPDFNRGCYGCFGPTHQANSSSMVDHYRKSGKTGAELLPLLRNFNAASPEFKKAADRLIEIEGLGGVPKSRATPNGMEGGRDE